jgi:hypothetical protein
MKFGIGIQSENIWENFILVCTCLLLNPCVTESPS